MGAMRKGAGFASYPCAAGAALRKGSGVPRAFLLTVSMPRFAKSMREKIFDAQGGR